MPYFSQEQKSMIAPAVKAVCKKYGVSGSLSVRNNSEVVLNVSKGKIDFFKSYNEIRAAKCALHGEAIPVPCCDDLDVNVYHFEKQFDGEAKDFLKEVYAILNEGNYDRSNIQSDFFDTRFYVSIKIGRWDKPYQLIA